MGWWKIRNVETGQIDFDAVKKRGKHEEYTEDKLLNGDEVADSLHEAFDKINAIYQREWGRPIKKDEARAAWNFVVNGYFRMLAKQKKDKPIPYSVVPNPPPVGAGKK